MDHSVAQCPHHEVPAVRACDRCRRGFCEACLVRLRNEWLCSGCKHAVLSRSFTVVGVAAPPAAGAAAPLGSPCSTHPAEEAVAICERCGDFMCALCTTPFEGRYYCLSCFELQWGRGALLADRGKDAGLGVPSVLFGVSALLCFWLPPFTLVLAVAGCAFGAGALLSRNQPRGFAVTGIALSLLGLLAALVIWLLPRF